MDQSGQGASLCRGMIQNGRVLRKINCSLKWRGGSFNSLAGKSCLSMRLPHRGLDSRPEMKASILGCCRANQGQCQVFFHGECAGGWLSEACNVCANTLIRLFVGINERK